MKNKFSIYLDWWRASARLRNDDIFTSRRLLLFGSGDRWNNRGHRWHRSDKDLSNSSWWRLLAFWNTDNSHWFTIGTRNNGSRTNNVDRWLRNWARWWWRRRRWWWWDGRSWQRWHINLLPIGSKELAVSWADGRLDRTARFNVSAINVVLAVDERWRRWSDAWNSRGQSAGAGRWKDTLGLIGHASESRLQRWSAEANGRRRCN